MSSGPSGPGRWYCILKPYSPEAIVSRIEQGSHAKRKHVFATCPSLRLQIICLFLDMNADTQYSNGLSSMSPGTEFKVPQPSPFRERDIIIAIMGSTGSGKSTFICKAANLPEDEIVGHTLRSQTKDVKAYSIALPEDIRLILVDTPGFGDTDIDEVQTLGTIADWLSTSYGQGAKLNGLLYMHPINKTRMDGSSVEHLGMFRRLCGDEVLGNVVLVTTMWDIERPEQAILRETELKQDFWLPMIALGSRTERFDNTIESAEQVITSLLVRPAITLALQRELVDNQRTLYETAVGAYLDQSIAAKAMREVEAAKTLERELLAARQRRDPAEQTFQEAYDRRLRVVQRSQQAREKLRSWTFLAATIGIVALSSVAGWVFLTYETALATAGIILRSPALQRGAVWFLSLAFGLR